MGCIWSMCKNLNTCVFWINQIQMKQCCRKVVSGSRVAGAIRSLANGRSLQFECARVSHESPRPCSYVG